MALNDLIPDPNAPPPSMNVSAMPGGLPQLGTPLLPLVGLNQRGQQEQGLQNRISSYENPQKPQGFWQNVRHIAATIGNVAGDVVAPSTMALIPGTQLHNHIQNTQNVRELAGLQGEDREDQTQADTASAIPSQNALRIAEAANQTSEANDRDNPRLPADAWSIDNTYQGPNGEPVEVNKTTGQARIAPGVHGITRIAPQEKGAEHVSILDDNGKPTEANFHPDTGKYTDVAGNEIKNPRPVPPPPNYGQLILPSKVETFLDPKTGLPTMMQYDPKTQTYSRPVGMSATNAYGHEAAQAGAVERAGENVISDLEKNKDKLGTLGAWIQKKGLNTPIADPTLQGIQTELSSFAALNPAMHGARGAEAMKHFETLIGGLQQNPEATIAGIRSIIHTANAINPGMNNQQSTSSAPSSKADYTYVPGKGLVKN